MKSLLKYTLTAITVIAVLLIAGYFLAPEKPGATLAIWDDEQATETERASVAAKGKSLEAGQVDSSNQLTFAYCDEMLTKMNELAVADAESADYLAAGYSLDEITLAVEYFVSPEWATRFRIEKLRELEYGDSEDALALNNLSPDNFSKMTRAEKLSVFVAADITVDDVAYFIGHQPFTDEDILTMLSYLDEPTLVVRFGRVDALSLLDYAAQAGRLEVFKALLNLGLQPTSDTYLKSTMEWALTALTQCDSNCEDAVEIVRVLQSMGEAARFDVKDDNHIRAQFSREPLYIYDGLYDAVDYEFFESDIRSFVQDYGLDLRQIEARPAPKLDNSHPLIVELQQRGHRALQKVYPEFIEKVKSGCELRIEAVAKQWNPPSVAEVIRMTQARYPDSPERIEAELARIDPALVDAYQHWHPEYKASSATLDEMIWQVWDRIGAASLDDVLEYYGSQPLTDKQRRALVAHLLQISPEYYNALRRNGLMTESVQYFDLEDVLDPLFVEELSRVGADLYGADTRNKSLLFYVVNQAELEAVEYLEAHGYPFSFSGPGQDPLHVALRASRFGFSPEFTAQVVPVLMRFHPEIDDFHRSRMAVIQLKYPDLYDELTSSYPQLAVRPDTELPRVR